MRTNNNKVLGEFMLESVSAARSEVTSQNRINWVKSLPFFGLHLACFAAIFTDVSWGALGLCISLQVIRMFAITAGYHRYFAHRTYRTSRWFQFVLAWIGCSALQKGPLWWASHHRHHHQHSDQGEDVHSPERLGFWWSHLGWILCSKYQDTNLRRIRDFANYPELRWLNHFHVIPGLVLAVGCFLLAGWQGLVWGFFISTVLLYHSTFAINSLCHMFGKRRYETTDTSRNSLLLALLTMGEGWHNNHHYYSTSVNQGFFWWELDISYYFLRLLSFFRVVWDLKTTPRHILEAAKV
jgi:stearoyl-CoA desaturase (delta-9 desaturase)